MGLNLEKSTKTLVLIQCMIGRNRTLALSYKTDATPDELTDRENFGRPVFFFWSPTDLTNELTNTRA